MKRRMFNVATVLALVSGQGMWGADPGRVRFLRVARPDLDRYTNAPTRERQQWFRTHFNRMVVFSPYFDNKTSWYPNGLVYFNLYGIPRDSPRVHEHPEQVLHDASGRLLYIPWGCGNGICPQYAGDITNPGFRSAWIQEAHAVLSRGYRGLWIDDVNMEFRVSDGNGKQVVPMDSTTGRPMTWEAWRKYVAEFVEEIRKAFPKIEITHNSIWFAGPANVRDADPAIERQIAAADNINVERGIASDTGLTGGTGEWSLHALFAFVDHVHAIGRSVTMQEYSLDASNREYGLAGYYLIASNNDRFGDITTNPETWWSGYDLDLGAPTAPRTYSNGVFQRRFACGIVLLGEPGLASKRIDFDERLATLDGRPVHSVELSGRQGIILRSCQAAPSPKKRY